MYYYTDGLPCSAKPPFPAPAYHDVDYAEGGDVIERTHINCHHNFRTGVPQICNFHKLSRMDISRPNTGIFLYGTPGPFSRRGIRNEKSPIFALSSPSPICPLLYAGTAGRVYELEILAMNSSSHLMDPYFAGLSDVFHTKLAGGLAMYEMDGTDSAQVAYIPSKIYKQRLGDHTIKESLIGNESRLDPRWE
jgi:hypothetical protein